MIARRTVSPLVGALLGLAGIAVVITAFWAFLPHSPHAIPALLLLVPIAFTSAVSGWRYAVPVAAVAAFGFALALIPPIGAVRIGLTEDVFVLVTFVVVSVVVSVLTSPNRSAADPAVLDEQRAVLLRSVSHDLRTPLNTIRVISSDLRDGSGRYDADTRHELLGRVVDESERLDRIVGNLLSATRVQAGALIPTLAPESIAQLAQGSVRRLDRTGTHVIVSQLSSDLPDVSADAVQIDQVLTNLVENSLRCSPPGSCICLHAQVLGDMVEVTVSDDGPGFDADQLDTLFHPFQHPELRSTGLGLAVCKAIVEAHGGTISVRDEPTVGAHVSFTLPVHRD